MSNSPADYQAIQRSKVDELAVVTQYEENDEHTIMRYAKAVETMP
jgi:hypothetical protein